MNLETDPNDDAQRLVEWLGYFGGPVARPQSREQRKRLMAEMCAAGADRMFPLLSPVLTGPDSELRCAACEAAVHIDARRASELLLPLLDDPDITVRWQASGCLHDVGDERAVAPLIRVLQSDPDPQIRNTAAYALGGIGSLAAIPALLAAVESDHELDELGYSASGCAKTALDDILRTNETRIRLADGLCKMQDRPPDVERLKRLARESYDDWSKRQAEPDSAAGGGGDTGSP